jgi:hypothetical protein
MNGISSALAPLAVTAIAAVTLAPRPAPSFPKVSSNSPARFLSAELLEKMKKVLIHEEFQRIRVTPNVYTALSELDGFCEPMGLIARNGLPS